MDTGRCLWWYGGQGQAQYAGVCIVLTHRPFVVGVRRFIEIDYRPSASRALLRLPHQRKRIEMSLAEREACDRILDRMAREGRAVFVEAKP